MNQYVALIVAGFVGVGLATGGSYDLEALDISGNSDLEQAKNLWNSNLDEVPGSLKDRLDGNINLVILGDVEGFEDPGNPFGVKFDEGEIVEFQEGGYDDARAIITTDAETVEKVASSSDPGATLRTAYFNDKVQLDIGTGSVDSSEEESVPAQEVSSKSPISKVNDFLFLVLG